MVSNHVNVICVYLQQSMFNKSI